MKDNSLKRQLIVVTYIAFLLFSILRFDIMKSIPPQVLGVLMPFLMGIVIAFILNKPMVLFKKLLGKIIKNEKICKGLAIMISYIIFFAIIIGVFMFIVPQLLENIKTFIDSLGTYIRKLETFIYTIAQEYDFENIDLQPIIGEVNGVIRNLSTSLLNYIANLVPRLVAMTSNMVSILFNVVITLIVSINLLAGKEVLLHQTKKVLFTYVPKKAALKIEEVAVLSNDIFGKYVVGQLTEACILGGMCLIGMRIFGFDYSVLISTLIAITALIPFAGAWIGGGISFLLLALVSPMRALLFLIYLLVLQQFETNVIYPKVVGSSIGLPGVWVIFGVVVGGGLFGFVGVMLGVPVMSIIYALVRADVNKKARKKEQIIVEKNLIEKKPIEKKPIKKKTVSQ